MAFNIWIVDDDISFSARLKEAIQASPILASDQKKIEIFHRPGHFLERLSKTVKEPQKRPHLVFLDIQMPGQNGLDVYCEIKQSNDPVLGALHFCSSMSYGVVQDFFIEKGMEVPPFVQKREVLGKLDLILARYVPEGEPVKVQVQWPVKQAADHLRAGFEKLKDLYYGAGLKGGENLAPLLQPLQEFAMSCGAKDLTARLQDLISQVEAKKPLLPMKLRREVKDLLTLGDKVLKHIPK